MSDARDRILTKMKTILVDQLDADANTVTESTTFVDDLGADSLAVVELVLALEESFGVTIPDEDAEKLQTVGDAVTYVLDKGGAVAAE